MTHPDDENDITGDFPPPEFPVCGIRLLLAVCILVVLIIIGLFIWLMIHQKALEKRDTGESSKGVSLKTQHESIASEMPIEMSEVMRGRAS